MVSVKWIKIWAMLTIFTAIVQIAIIALMIWRMN